MAFMLKDDLSNDLKHLKLPAMAGNLDSRAHQAEEGKLGYLEFTQLLVQDEFASCESNSFQKRLQGSRCLKPHDLRNLRL